MKGLWLEGGNFDFSPYNSAVTYDALTAKYEKECMNIFLHRTTESCFCIVDLAPFYCLH